MTYLLAGIGLCCGFFALLLGFLSGSSPTSINPDANDLPDFRGFFKLLGVFISVFSLFSIFGCILFNKEYKLGWLMLFLVYLTGSLATGYILFISISKLFPLALASPLFYIYLVLMLLGIYVLYNLVFNINYLLGKTDKKLQKRNG